HQSHHTHGLRLHSCRRVRFLFCEPGTSVSASCRAIQTRPVPAQTHSNQMTLRVDERVCSRAFRDPDDAQLSASGKTKTKTTARPSLQSVNRYCLYLAVRFASQTFLRGHTRAKATRRSRSIRQTNSFPL